MIRIILSFLVLSLITSCSSVKEGLTLKKKDNADEFLVKKKNPLILPPDFEQLPTPSDSEKSVEVSEINEIEELLSKNKNKTKKSKIINSSNKVEQNILDKIKTK